ncbi:choice-of-anchor B family protein [candidate division KSB1 bacterium]|nr:choice-of-anchor B family protein [candidate division KSB1 bacterium]
MQNFQTLPRVEKKSFAKIFPLLFLLSLTNAFAQYVPGVNNNITLLSHQDKYNNYSNIWGYTDDKGNEYALVGADIGLSVVNITDPRHPVEVDFVPGPGPTAWREIKTYSHYAYVVSEASSPSEYSGVQIVDLSTLPDSVKSFHSYLWPNVTASNARAHSVSVDAAGYLYIQGGNATGGISGLSGGVRILSLADPKTPAPVSVINVRYVHDSFTKNDLLFNSNIYEGGHVDVFDIHDRANPKLLTSIKYPEGFSHNSGTTEDGNYLITTDEEADYTVKFWDIRVLWDNNPNNDSEVELVAEYAIPPGTIAHNVHVKGTHAYISHYVEGVKVLDISNPSAPAEVGYYDTFPQNVFGFNGDWGVFPYFPSGNFVISDIQTGLYVLRLDHTGVGEVHGRITNRETGETLAGATVHFIEANRFLTTDGNGEYALRTSTGSHTVVVQAFPFASDTSQITLTGNLAVQHDRTLQSLLALSNLLGQVRDAQGNGIRAQITLHVSSNVANAFTLTDSSDASGNYAFENIFTSSPPVLAYDQMVISPVVPFAAQTLRDITVAAGAPTVLDFVLEPAEVLLVNDDPAGDYSDYYLSALAKINVTAYPWSRNERGPVPVSAMRQFKSNVIIWYTGNAAGGEVLTAAERDSIAAHLERGGNIFLTGQNLAESLQGTAFLRDRLHVAFAQNSTDLLLNGVPNDPVGNGLNSIVTAGVGGANNQNSRDVLQPDAGAHASIVYDLATMQVAGVRVEDAVHHSRLVLFGFGLEAVSARAGFASRENILTNVLNWLNGMTAVAEPPAASALPGEFRLSPSYPNPWHATAHETVVRYDLPANLAAQRVSLKVYDALGREIAVLIDKTYAPGSFTARWNGRNALGEIVKSGVYFCKLQAGELQQVRKIVFVR